MKLFEVYNCGKRKGEFMTLIDDGESVLMTPALQALNAFDSPPLVLLGRIVPVEGEVIDDGALYIRDGKIVAVQQRADEAPDGFDSVAPVETGGTMYPGLLDLHNHLVYNVIAPWEVPKRYDNRGQWQRDTSYAEQVKLPIKTLASYEPTIPALVRYVETKALASGTTSVQGMKSMYSTTLPYFTGAVRNFEATGDKNLPAASTRIPDVNFAKDDDVEAFRKSVTAATNRKAALFYHLCEGIDDKTRTIYTNMTKQKLLAKSVAAIHCLALNQDDFTSFDGIGCHMVWSPLSNSLLYGQTIDPKLLVKRQFTIGCDWSPSGGKNLLEELKVAWLTIQEAKVKIPARALVEAVTKNAAAAVGWQKSLGTLEADKYADVVVIKGKAGDAYEHLILATEREVRLVLIAGYARYGDEDLMKKIPSAGTERESLKVGGVKKVIDNFDPGSKLDISYEEARKRLADAMADLPGVVNSLKDVLNSVGPEGMAEPLMLDNDLADDDADVAGLFALQAAELPKSVPLDALTVVDDAIHFDRIEAVGHFPAHLKKLRALY
jgi:5-methylthioadenosine/S-adenosylhomocysteine deaminase